MKIIISQTILDSRFTTATLLLFFCHIIHSQLRERLISLDRNNQKNLELIETSLFALVLDENVPETDTEVRIK